MVEGPGAFEIGTEKRDVCGDDASRPGQLPRERGLAVARRVSVSAWPSSSSRARIIPNTCFTDDQ